MADEDSIVMKTISVIKDIVGHGQGGLTYTSDQITYPGDIQQIDDDVATKTAAVAGFHKAAALYHGDDIWFSVHGQFRAYDQTIENDPASRVMPVLANVYVDLERSDKADLTELEVHFAALQKPYGTPQDPRIRFLCDGHYDPAGSGDVRFRAVVEIDQNANVSVIESQITGGDGSIVEGSPSGFYVTIEGD